MKNLKRMTKDLLIIAIMNIFFALLIGVLQTKTRFDIINLAVIPFVLILNSIIVSIVYCIRVCSRTERFGKRHAAILILFLTLSYYGSQYYVFNHTYINTNYRINYQADGMLLKDMKSRKTGEKIEFPEYYAFALENKTITGKIVNREKKSMTIGIFLELLNILSQIIMPLFLLNSKKIEGSGNRGEFEGEFGDIFEEMFGQANK